MAKNLLEIANQSQLINLTEQLATISFFQCCLPSLDKAFAVLTIFEIIIFGVQRQSTTAAEEHYIGMLSKSQTYKTE